MEHEGREGRAVEGRGDITRGVGLLFVFSASLRHSRADGLMSGREFAVEETA